MVDWDYLRHVRQVGKEMGLDVEAEFKELMDQLERVGLTTYEAKGYLALVARGVSTADTVADTANIPRTSAYKVLESLRKKGWAEATKGRPIIYKPEPPAVMKARLVEEVEETFDKLIIYESILREQGVPQLIFTITGRELVMERMAQLIDDTTESLTISTPVFSEVRKALEKQLTRAVKRGVQVTVITGPNQKVPEGMDVVRRDKLVATDVVGDGRRALIADADLGACGYTDNELLVQHLTRFIDILAEQR